MQYIQKYNGNDIINIPFVKKMYLKVNDIYTCESFMPLY